jgi:CheY-like chemotaxis protein
MALIMRGKLQLRVTAVELNKLMEDAVADARALIASRGQILSATPADAPIWMQADPTRLMQVLSNLLSNAAWYSDKGARIDINLSRSGNDAVFTVIDNGMGIEAAAIANIFDGFVQENPVSSSKIGLGLGLTVVRNLVELHGGTVQAFSEGRGKGSKFVVRLPIKNEASATSTGNGNAQAISSTSVKRALVVEDNPDVASSFTKLLKKLGLDVQLAQDGGSAIKLAQRTNPQVIFIDIGLPDMNGYELAKHLRTEKLVRNAVLVAVTGFGSPTDVEQAMQAGFDQHMAKPPQVEQLMELFAKIPSVPDKPPR